MKPVRTGVVFALVCVGIVSGQSPGSKSSAEATQRAGRPNVVLIMMDDLGYGDLGSYGAPDVKTPNTDRLAREGVRFTESYANGPVCSPTRAALITGRYQQRVGVEWALPPTEMGLPVSAASLPARLKRSGYATGLMGKWHLGNTPEQGPNAHGFDEFFGFLGAIIDSYTHLSLNAQPDLYENTTPVTAEGYFTDVITDRAVGFINRHAAAPFFLEVTYNAVHMPFQPPDDLPPGAPRERRPLGELPGDPHAHTRQDYVRMLERVDVGVGKMMSALEARGLSGNTLVIFTSDNGGEWLSRNAPFFNFKGTLWEGGTRVPLIMSWRDHLPAGTTSHKSR